MNEIERPHRSRYSERRFLPRRRGHYYATQHDRLEVSYLQSIRYITTARTAECTPLMRAPHASTIGQAQTIPSDRTVVNTGVDFSENSCVVLAGNLATSILDCLPLTHVGKPDLEGEISQSRHSHKQIQLQT